MMRCAVVAVLAALALGAGPVAGQQDGSRTGCEQCHGERTVEPGAFTLTVGRSATDSEAAQVEFSVE